MGGAENRQYAALIEYLEENQERFYRIAFSYAKNRESALDLVQDAIVRAITNISSLKKQEYLKTWFYRILVNECLMYLRKNKILFLPDLEEQFDLPHSDKRFEDIELYEAVQQLEPELKTVVILRFFEDLKLEDIARITKTNLSTVKSRLYRALKLLRVSIEEAKLDE
ncbi:MAG TPA: sigma-70 family RNA polymerase sigma factor [Firmicutes bacterium]|nr:sigma-70 family RNA polymerase sigma factor [Bacillota bacterium]